MVIGFGLQTFYSIQHIRAAAYFARRAGRIERRYDGSLISPLLPAIQANATGALFSAVAFLEATANELFADASESGGGHLSGLDPSHLTVIARLGATDAVERATVMDKFDILLSAAGLEPLERGARPAQDVAALIKLRNGLIHYQAAWLDIGTDDMVRHGSLVKSRLRKEIAARFQPRRNAGVTDSSAWIGYGCARWAVESSIAFTDAVCRRLRITAIYEHVRGDLNVA